MATIAQIVAQIRTAIFGKDVRENIAQGIEKCYTDVSSGVTLATTAANNANTKATAAQNAATAANAAAESASEAASTIDTKIEKATNAAVSNNNVLNDKFYFVNYGYSPNASIAEEPSSGIYKRRVGVSQNLEMIEVNCSNPNDEYDYRLKLTNGLDRGATNIDADAWDTGISLIAGHRYSLKTKYLSGNITPGEGVTKYPLALMYKAGGHINSLVHIERDGYNSIGDFIAEEDAEYNVLFYVYKNITLINVKYEVILTDETAKENDPITTELETINTNLNDAQEEISDLKDAFEATTKFSIVEGWNIGKRIYTTDDPVSFELVTRDDYNCIVVDCSEGDIFTLTGGNTTSAYRLYCFTKADGTIVSKPSSNYVWTEHKLITPAEATKLIINVSTTYPYALYRGRVIDKELGLCETDIEDIKSDIGDIKPRLNNTEYIVDQTNLYNYRKEKMFEGLPFYKIKAPLSSKRYSYNMVDNEWVEGGSYRWATDIIPCPKFLMMQFKKVTFSLVIYIGDLVDGEFVVDKTYHFRTSGQGVINIIDRVSGFKTIETDGTKYMWLGVVYKNTREYYYDEDSFILIGADEWPESPVLPNAWSIYSDNGSNTCLNNSVVNSGYYLPEKSWIFVKDPGEISWVSFGIGSSASSPWTTIRKNISAYYIPENSGMPMLTVRKEAVINKNTLCIVPDKIIDKCTSSNAIKVVKFVEEIINKFRFIGKNNTVNIASGLPITIGKEYHTIPYSGRWNGQHAVCYDTTPETAANAANDEYSVFYDTGENRSELSADDEMRPGYGGVCSTFAALATGCPYPQTTDGFLVDKNFEVDLLDNPRSGDVVLVKTDSNEHGAFVENVFDNGYTVCEYAPPGIIQSIHTSKNPVKKADYRVNSNYLNPYNYKIASKDRSGWKTNYLNFDYEIANGSIRPWRGNKSVCSDYNRMTHTNTSLSKHTGIHITVHDGATTAYIKKPSGTVVSLNVAGQTIVNIESIVDEVGQYELYSNVSNVKEYFRYFEHDPVTISLAEDGTCSFSSDDVDYAFVWAYATDTGYPECPRASVSVMAKGKKYPGIVLRGVKCAMVRDTTVVNGEEDSWGRYPIFCTEQTEQT